MAIYYGLSKTPYVLDQPLGHGGEGEVYSIKGRFDLVAKLYNSNKLKPTNYNPNPRQQLKEKIKTMLEQPVNAYTPKGILIVAWPQDALFDGSGQFVGYTMPRVQSKYHIFAASRERERKELYPDYTWKTAVTIACNLAMAVWNVNSTGAVIGDMNPNNIMVDEHGRVTLIDTDSFNITNRRTGKTYKCSVGVPEMLPPELQGVNLANPTNKFTEQTDGFSLSIHIFNLLMNNCHPFGVSGMNKSKSSSSNAPVAKHIVRGECPYVTGRHGRLTSPDAPDVAMLPKYIRELFDRAFSYDVTTAVKAVTIAKRPTSQEWMTALGLLLRSDMTSCNKDASHVYPAGYPQCPWCRQPTQNLPLPQKYRISDFRLPFLKLAAVGGAATLAIILFPVCKNYLANFLTPPQAPLMQTGDLQAGNLQMGDLQAGDLQMGDLQTGDLQAGDLQAGDLQTGDSHTDDYMLLSQLEWLAESQNNAFKNYEMVKDIFGTTYTNGIGGTSACSEWREYAPNGTYNTFRGRIVLDYECRAHQSDIGLVSIYGDGELIFQSSEVKAGCEPQDFKVDISRIGILRIEIDNNVNPEWSGCKNGVRLVDCGLYTDSSVPMVSTVVKAIPCNQTSVSLSDLDWFNGGGGYGEIYNAGTVLKYYTGENAVTDNLGSTYDNGITGNSGYYGGLSIDNPRYWDSVSWQEWWLGGTYQKMDGRVVMEYSSRNATGGGVYIWIYGDGELLFQSNEIVAGFEPQDFIIDLSNITVLRVAIQGGPQGGAIAMLVNCTLYKE